MDKQAFSKKLTRTGDGESAIKYVWQLKWTLWRNICIIKIIQRLIVRGSTTYTRLPRPSMPMPRKSVLGSSPWNPVRIINIHILFLNEIATLVFIIHYLIPIDCHCFVTLFSRGVSGLRRVHSWRSSISCWRFPSLNGSDLDMEDNDGDSETF